MVLPRGLLLLAGRMRGEEGQARATVMAKGSQPQAPRPRTVSTVGLAWNPLVGVR